MFLACLSIFWSTFFYLLFILFIHFIPFLLILFYLQLCLCHPHTHPTTTDDSMNGNDEREEGLEYCGLIRSTGNSGHYPAVVLQGHHSATTSIFQHALKYKRFDWFYSCDSVERRRQPRETRGNLVKNLKFTNQASLRCGK